MKPKQKFGQAPIIPKFNPGDTVRLINDSKVMTVKCYAFSFDEVYKNVICCWLDEQNNYKTGNYNESELLLIKGAVQNL